MPDHQLVSDAAPVVSGPSFSSAPAVSGTNTRTYTTIRYMVKNLSKEEKSKSKDIERKRILMEKMMMKEEKEEKLKEYDYNVEKLSKDIGRKSILMEKEEKEEKLKEYDYNVEKLSKDIGRKSILELGTIIDIFDAKNMGDPKYGGDPVPILDFKTDRPLVNRLTKCADLALKDYNSRMKTNYRFVDFEMAVWQPVNGVFYHITFRARNAEKEYQTFQATLFADRLMREVVKFRMKGSNTWHPGSLKEMI